MTPDDDFTRPSTAAQHTVFARPSLKVAPTDGTTKFNAIRIPLIPVACWRLNDPSFAFDSSFVSPSFRGEFVSPQGSSGTPAPSPLATLSDIVQKNPGCPAALFAHCDPEGSDALNKTLGDRRAIAVYAVLTRQPDLWAYLYDTPQVGDSWDTHAIQTILQSLLDGSGAPYYGGAIDGDYGPGTTKAVQNFQTDAGQPASGKADAATRKALFGAYMDWLCTPAVDTPDADDADAASPPASAPAATPFRMQPGDFLGGAGAQPGDLPKMSLQSCGKFNPVVLLPTDEMSGGDTDQRHADDAPNRRVLLFFFAKDTTVDPGQWPCPKVKDAGDACHSAFWPAGPDGDTRRKNGAALREYRETRDTMACQFYDRFARRSPCEGAPGKLASIIIRVIVDGAGTPIPKRPFKLTVQGTLPSAVPWAIDIAGTTDDDGYVRARVPPSTATGTLVVQHLEDDGTLTDVWSLDLQFADLTTADTVQGAQDRLANLGLAPGGTDGTLDETTMRAINRFRELQKLPVIAPPGPGETPDVATLLDGTTVKGLDALYAGEGGADGSGGGG